MSTSNTKPRPHDVWVCWGLPALVALAGCAAQPTGDTRQASPSAVTVPMPSAAPMPMPRPAPVPQPSHGSSVPPAPPSQSGSPPSTPSEGKSAPGSVGGPGGGASPGGSSADCRTPGCRSPSAVTTTASPPPAPIKGARPDLKNVGAPIGKQGPLLVKPSAMQAQPAARPSVQQIAPAGPAGAERSKALAAPAAAVPGQGTVQKKAAIPGGDAVKAVKPAEKAVDAGKRPAVPALPAR